MKEVGSRLLEHGLTLSWTDGAKKYLAEEGFDPKMGARPLRRTIQEKVEDQLSDDLLNGKYSAGDTIEIDADKGILKVELSNKELAKRKKKWKPKKIEYNSGTLWKYSQSVGPAFKGAVTHPGASKEKKSYADI